MGNVCLKPNHSQYFINYLYSLIDKSSIWKEPVKRFLRQLSSLLFGGKYQKIFFLMPWGDRLRHALYFLARLCQILKDFHSLMVSKQPNAFRCTRWFQDLNLNFIDHALSSAVSAVMQPPYIDRLNSFSLSEISARYASCCIQETSEKKWANDVCFSDKKYSFFSLLKHPHQNFATRQPTNFGI